jgi:tellurium resistance protein TerD
MAARPMLRGSNVALTREIPNLTGVVLGITLTSSEPVLIENLVMATLLCDAHSRVLSDEHVVFFNQLVEPGQSVTQRAEPAGHDLEQVEVDLPAVPAEVARIVVVAYINEALGGHRTLGQLHEATVRVLNLVDDTELVRSEDLAPSLTSETGMVLGELYRLGGDWKFKVIGQGYANGMLGIAADYGIRL